jgi:hypothetical protein
MAIVPAGVHFPWDSRGVSGCGEFLDVQRIEIGPQADRTRAGQSAVQGPDYACRCNPLGDGNAEAAQLIGHQRGRPHLFEADFRVLMDPMAQRNQIG